MRRIALVVLTGAPSGRAFANHTDRIAAIVAVATPVSYSEVEIPFEPEFDGLEPG